MKLSKQIHTFANSIIRRRVNQDQTDLVVLEEELQIVHILELDKLEGDWGTVKLLRG